MTRTTDITNFTDHRQNLRKHLNRIKKTGRPLYITTNGETDAVLLSAKSYDELADRADLAGTLRMIERSEADIKAGRVMDTRQALQTIAKKHGLRTGPLMTYHVVIPSEVLDAINTQVAYLRSEGAPRDRLDGWLTRLFALIDSLDRWPRRYALAEIVTAAKGYEVRRMNFGDYAIFYRIDDERRLVELIAFRHGRQRPWLEKQSS